VTTAPSGKNRPVDDPHSQGVVSHILGIGAQYYLRPAPIRTCDPAMTGYAIVLASGKLERLQAVSNIASIAAASDVPVDVFATMDGLEAFDAATVETGDFEMGALGRAMLNHDDADMPLFTESLERARDLGDIEVFACELSMDMLGKDLDEYVDLFDDVLGVAGFLNRAQDKQVVFV